MTSPIAAQFSKRNYAAMRTTARLAVRRAEIDRTSCISRIRAPSSVAKQSEYLVNLDNQFEFKLFCVAGRTDHLFCEQRNLFSVIVRRVTTLRLKLLPESGTIIKTTLNYFLYNKQSQIKFSFGRLREYLSIHFRRQAKLCLGNRNDCEEFKQKCHLFFNSRVQYPSASNRRFNLFHVFAPLLPTT